MAGELGAEFSSSGIKIEGTEYNKSNSSEFMNFKAAYEIPFLKPVKQANTIFGAFGYNNEALQTLADLADERYTYSDTTDLSNDFNKIDFGVHNNSFIDRVEEDNDLEELGIDRTELEQIMADCWHKVIDAVNVGALPTFFQVNQQESASTPGLTLSTIKGPCETFQGSNIGADYPEWVTLANISYETEPSTVFAANTTSPSSQALAVVESNSQWNALTSDVTPPGILPSGTLSVDTDVANRPPSDGCVETGLTELEKNKNTCIYPNLKTLDSWTTGLNTILDTGTFGQGNNFGDHSPVNTCTTPLTTTPDQTLSTIEQNTTPQQLQEALQINSTHPGVTLDWCGTKIHIPKTGPELVRLDLSNSVETAPGNEILLQDDGQLNIYTYINLHGPQHASTIELKNPVLKTINGLETELTVETCYQTRPTLTKCHLTTNNVNFSNSGTKETFTLETDTYIDNQKDTTNSTPPPELVIGEEEDEPSGKYYIKSAYDVFTGQELMIKNRPDGVPAPYLAPGETVWRVTLVNETGHNIADPSVEAGGTNFLCELDPEIEDFLLDIAAGDTENDCYLPVSIPEETVVESDFLVAVGKVGDEEGEEIRSEPVAYDYGSNGMPRPWWEPRVECDGERYDEMVEFFIYPFGLPMVDVLKVDGFDTACGNLFVDGGVSDGDGGVTDLVTSLPVVRWSPASANATSERPWQTQDNLEPLFVLPDGNVGSELVAVQAAQFVSPEISGRSFWNVAYRGTRGSTPFLHYCPTDFSDAHIGNQFIPEQEQGFCTGIEEQIGNGVAFGPENMARDLRTAIAELGPYFDFAKADASGYGFGGQVLQWALKDDENGGGQIGDVIDRSVLSMTSRIDAEAHAFTQIQTARDVLSRHVKICEEDAECDREFPNLDTILSDLNAQEMSWVISRSGAFPRFLDFGAGSMDDPLSWADANFTVDTENWIFPSLIFSAKGIFSDPDAYEAWLFWLLDEDSFKFDADQAAALCGTHWQYRDTDDLKDLFGSSSEKSFVDSWLEIIGDVRETCETFRTRIGMPLDDSRAVRLSPDSEALVIWAELDLNESGEDLADSLGTHVGDLMLPNTQHAVTECLIAVTATYLDQTANPPCVAALEAGLPGDLVTDIIDSP